LASRVPTWLNYEARCTGLKCAYIQTHKNCVLHFYLQKFASLIFHI